MLNNMKFYSTIVFLTVLVACGDKKANQQQQGPPPATPVSVAKVELADATYFDEYPATVSALNEVELRAQVNGYVTGIHFKDGDQVKKGQRLYTIDARVYNANAEQAVANLQVQETNLIKAQKDADRYHTLDKQDAIAKQQVDYADAALEAAKKQVAAAKAAVNSLKANVGFANIVAPFNGTIGISQVRMGGLVTAGNTLLNTVSTVNPIAVDFNINEKDIQRFNELQRRGSVEKDSVLRIELPGSGLYPIPGRITTIDRAVNTNTGTITVRASFANNEGWLRAGMNTTLRVLNRSAEKQLVIPYKAVTEQLGQSSAFVVSDSSTAEQRTILLGKRIGDNVIVTKGLAEGEVIIVDGIINVKNGVKVTTQAPQQAKKP